MIEYDDNPKKPIVVEITKDKLVIFLSQLFTREEWFSFRSWFIEGGHPISEVIRKVADLLEAKGK